MGYYVQEMRAAIQVAAPGRLAALVMIATTAACLVSPDENLWKARARDAAPDGPADGPADHAPGPDHDVATDGSGPDGPLCLPTGVKASCDPLNVSGCAQGSCYIVLYKGSVCVCPAGTIATGGTCYTTVECAPGNVCAAPAPPTGICRATCDPAASSPCPSGESCTAINGLPKWGYCAP